MAKIELKPGADPLQVAEDLRKFKTLYDGWRAQGLRKKLHSGSFYTLCWTRGWLSPKAADSLREYIGLR